MALASPDSTCRGLHFTSHQERGRVDELGGSDQRVFQEHARVFQSEGDRRADLGIVLIYHIRLQDPGSVAGLDAAIPEKSFAPFVQADVMVLLETKQHAVFAINNGIVFINKLVDPVPEPPKPDDEAEAEESTDSEARE